MNEKEMKTFSFVDFEKIRQASRMLSLYGIYGLKNDIMIDDEKHIVGKNNLQDVIQKREEGII